MLNYLGQFAYTQEVLNRYGDGGYNSVIPIGKDMTERRRTSGGGIGGVEGGGRGLVVYYEDAAGRMDVFRSHTGAEVDL